MEPPRPVKRRRISLPESDGIITSPATNLDCEKIISTRYEGDHEDDLLERATHVLATEAAALANINHMYRSSATARSSLKNAINAIVTVQSRGGKLVICGVGKSAYIAQKLTATCKSLSIRSSFLHACEAVHGDLGDVTDRDVLLFVSYSGKTPELLNLLPHVSDDVQIMAISGHESTSGCSLLQGRKDAVLLPAMIPEREEATFGVAAPSTSTTVALAVADMLALTVAEQMHTTRAKMNETFKRNHPGGAIGLNYQEAKKRKREGDEVAVLELPSPSISGSDDG